MCAPRCAELGDRPAARCGLAKMPPPCADDCPHAVPRRRVSPATTSTSRRSANPCDSLPERATRSGSSSWRNTTPARPCGRQAIAGRGSGASWRSSVFQPGRRAAVAPDIMLSAHVPRPAGRGEGGRSRSSTPGHLTSTWTTMSKQKPPIGGGLHSGEDGLRASRLAEAEQVYRQVLAAMPAHAETLHMLGVLALQSGQFGAALANIDQAIALRPATAMYHVNRANALLALGDKTAAVAACQEHCGTSATVQRRTRCWVTRWPMKQNDAAIEAYRAAPGTIVPARPAQQPRACAAPGGPVGGCGDAPAPGADAGAVGCAGAEQSGRGC